MESFDITYLLGKFVVFHRYGTACAGRVVGGYLDINQNGKRSVYLLVAPNDGLGISEVLAQICSVQDS